MYFSKFNKSSFLLLKNYQSCFTSLNNRILKSYIYYSKYKCFLDLSFNTLIEYKSIISCKKNLLVKVVYTKSLFENILIYNFLNQKKLIYNCIWYFIKKCYFNGCFLKGRILDVLENGYSIGICGTIGHLPKTDFILINSNKSLKVNIFFITKVNFIKKSYLLSQENILQQSTKTFFKLLKNKNLVLANISKRIKS